MLLFSVLSAQLKVGDPAPTFFVRDIAHQNFFLSDTLKLNKPTVLSFFATWCGPCRVEMPALDTLSQSYSDINFYLVNVSGLTQGKTKMKEDPEKVKKLIDDLGVTLQVLMDKYGKVAEKYGVKSLPRLVVIDQKSKVHYIHDGYAPGDEKKLKEVLDKLTVAKK
ncbi:MAG: TlpA disulfide reductase family protein [Candidatus Marinimicrobia bacterium]|nr:TlpA disulfide reductase family protein [Candidatus Neomarinimicrobiota bacterium]